MKLNNILAALIVILFQGCKVKEESTITSILLQNNTSHEIIINPYNLGIMDSSKAFSIQANQRHEIDYNFNRGKSTEPLKLSNYFKDVDSVQIIWDSQYKMTHMIADSFTSTGKYVSFSDPHNIGIVNNYVELLSEETQYSISFELIYTFTEQDYLDAKE